MRKQVTKLKKTVTDRRKTERYKYNPFAMLNAISVAQPMFITDYGTKVLFDKLLTDLLTLTKSKYGFIGEVLYSEKKEPYFKAYAISNIAWNKKTLKFDKENVTEGMEFRNLKTLFGRVMTSGKPVISNNPSKDPRLGGLPDGHPPLTAFLGLPFSRNDRIIGIIGIANRPGGYERQIVKFLEPFIITCRNIIEALRAEQMRRLTEKALWESEESFRSVFENSAVGIMRLGLDGRPLETNPAFEKMLGYRHKELTEMSYDVITHPDDIKKEKLFFKELSDGRFDNFTIQKRYIRRDGSIMWSEMTVSVVRDADSRPRHYISVIEDITERRKAEEDLRISNDRLTFSLDAAEQGLWDWNMKTGDVVYSGRWVSMLGYELGELEPNIGTWKSLLHPEDVSRVTRVMDDHLMKRKPFYETEFRLKDKSGEWTWILSCGKVTERDEDGEPLRMIGTHQNISERKKLEEQLLHSQKMKALGQLAGGIAHDFNNILTAIISYGNILKVKMDEYDDPLKYCIDAILVSSERAAILTRGLLSFSRKQMVDPRPIDLNNIIRKFESLLLRIICEDIKFMTELTDEALYVMTDRIQIEQVLMNLITNACDVMSRGGELTINTERVELDAKFAEAQGYGEAGEYACILVTDTGCGMDDETKSRIFEPFFTTKEVGKGTGLGLAIVYGTVKQHNGYINVESEAGKGTTFRIYLPLIEAKAEEKALEESPLVGGSETILIAEDEETVRIPLKMVLQEFGYNVIEAVDGEDAVNKFMENKDRIQLVVIDVVMPGKNGREVYEAIKKVSPDVKAIFTSGYTQDIIHAKGILDEGLRFIPKPVSPHELLGRVREVLDK